MNKLVIIGNGFDLAHGLPTSYGDFINWYWKEVVNHLKKNKENVKVYSDKLISISINYIYEYLKTKESLESFEKINSYSSLKDFVYSQNKFIAEQRYGEYNKISHGLKITNAFFRLICDTDSIKNWVDIENEYYQYVKGILKIDKLNEEKGIPRNNNHITKLNEEFEQVKQLFEKYLNEEIISKYDFSKPSNNIYNVLKYFEVNLREEVHGNYLEEFPKKLQERLMEETSFKLQAEKEKKLQTYIRENFIPENCVFLNFNYTFSVDYIKATMLNQYNRDIFRNAEIIQIHGRLNDPDNKINFGFGDEMDNHYQQIEEKDDNEYLKYIKSFQYLQNSNYKKVLDYIESDIFQVYIMGHSCGLSDRILLNTIFEHTNCVSIKVFYYKNGDWDNYTEIIQNISRHFNKKKMMRDKIVNKSLCEPLPQDIRFEKK